MSKPRPDEYSPYFQRYLDLVSEDDIVKALEEQEKATASRLSAVNEERAAYRYEPDKWSVKELVNHMADTERVFAYRALAIARGDQQSLPGFDEKSYAAASDADRRPIAEIIEDFRAARRATLAFLRGLSPDAWKRSGTANNNAVSVRALAYMTLGHERHHLKVLREKYGL